MTAPPASDALAPCPFCGGTARIVTRDVEPQGDPWYGRKDETFVLCDCGCCLFDGGFHEGFWDAETRAVAAWNRRAAPAVSPPPAPSTMAADLAQRIAVALECGVLWTKDTEAHQRMRAALADFNAWRNAGVKEDGNG